MRGIALLKLNSGCSLRPLWVDSTHPERPLSDYQIARVMQVSARACKVHQNDGRRRSAIRGLAAARQSAAVSPLGNLPRQWRRALMRRTFGAARGTRPRRRQFFHGGEHLVAD